MMMLFASPSNSFDFLKGSTNPLKPQNLRSAGFPMIDPSTFSLLMQVRFLFLQDPNLLPAVLKRQNQSVSVWVLSKSSLPCHFSVLGRP